MNGDTPDTLGPTGTPAPTDKPDTPDIARTNLLSGPVRANAVHVTVKTATVTVVVKDTGGTPLKDVEVEVTGTAKKNTGADGSAKFDAVPAGRRKTSRRARRIMARSLRPERRLRRARRWSRRRSRMARL